MGNFRNKTKQETKPEDMNFTKKQSEVETKVVEKREEPPRKK